MNDPKYGIPPMLYHGGMGHYLPSLHDLMERETRAIDVWLQHVMERHGITIDEVPMRCVLVRQDAERTLDGMPWIDRLHVEIDGERVDPSMQVIYTLKSSIRWDD